MQKPKVSLLCCTHNHEDYVRQAIDGMLMQETSFDCEILVRDDASTDNTPKILKEYEEKYPDRIKVYYEKENQRSIGVRRCFHILMRHAKGDYIALCDGDDFWTDPKKIQMQYDYMEEHPMCTFLVHDAVRYDQRTGEYGEHFYKRGVACDFDIKELITINRPASTSTFFFRNNDWEPDWYFRTIIGDTPLLLLRSEKGYLHYMPETMTTYRIGTGTSNMDLRTKDNPKKKILNNMEFIWIYDLLNKEMDYRYESFYEKRLNDLLYGTGQIAINNDIKVPKVVYKRLPLKMRIKMHIRETLRMKREMSKDSKPVE